MFRKRKKKPKVYEFEESMNAAQALLAEHENEDASTCDMHTTRRAIYDLEVILEEGKIRHEELQHDINDGFKEARTRLFSFFGGILTAALTMYKLIPAHPGRILIVSLIGAALSAAAFFTGFIAGFLSAAKDAENQQHQWHELTRRTRRRMNDFKVRRDELQDQANTTTITTAQDTSRRGFLRRG